MTTEQAVDSLQKIADTEFDRIFNSPWYKFPPELVRDELIRRLKLRTDLSLDSKKAQYKKIIDRFRMVMNTESWDQFLSESTAPDAAWVQRLERAKTRIEEMNEHYRQLSDLHSQRDDPFVGKTKPGDWRPDGAELCPVCDGNGKGADQRICGKCSGRGFIRR